MVKDCYASVKKRLAQAGIEDFSFETDVIFEEVFSRSFKLDMMIGRLDRKATDSEVSRLNSMVERRCKGEPLQYVIGKWEFYGMELSVGDGVLIPRQDTETLVDTAFELVRQKSSVRATDLCSGSGCIALALAELLNKNGTQYKITAAELYDKAFYYLEKNADRYSSLNVRVQKLDALNPDSLAVNGLDLDIITCNPPYLDDEDMSKLQREVSFEPKTALYGSSDGLDYYRIISRVWKNALTDGGYIVFEIGYKQSKAVESILQGEGYHSVRTVSDSTGKPRVVLGQKTCGGRSEYNFSD